MWLFYSSLITTDVCGTINEGACSLELSLDISDGGNKVDGASSDYHGWFGGEGSGGSSLDVFWGDFVDLVRILMESEVSVGEEVLGDFFESAFLLLEVGEDLHLELGLGSWEFFVAHSVSEVWKFLKSNTQEILRVRTSTLDVDTEDTVIWEVVVEWINIVDEIVSLGGLVSSVLALLWVTNEGLHKKMSSGVFMSPLHTIESEGNVSLWGLSPCSVFTTNVLWLGSLVEEFWDWEEFTKSFLDKFNVFLVIVNTWSNDQAFSWGDVVHDELLEHSSVNVVDVVLNTVSWHT